MKMCITKIHLGRYKLEMLDDNNQVVNGYDCGLAGLLVQLNSWICIDEALAYQQDQHKSSNELGNEAIRNMLNDPVLNSKGLRPALAKPYTYAYSEELCPNHVASAFDPKVCGRCGVHIDSLR